MRTTLSNKDILKNEAREKAKERFLDLLLPDLQLPRPVHVNDRSETWHKLKKLLEDGKLDDRVVDVSTADISRQDIQLLEKQLHSLTARALPMPPDILDSISWHFSFVSAVSLQQLAALVAPESQKEISEITAKLEGLYQRKTVKVPEAINLFFQDEYKKLLVINEITEESFDLCADPGEIEFIHRKLIESLHRDPEAIYRLSHREFEELIQELLIKLGYYVELTAQTRDGGCDLIAIRNDKLGIQTKYVVEAKHYRPPNKVGVNVVRQLNTVKQKYRGHHGLIVTSSYFTKDAVTENDQFYGLHLRDYGDLQEWLRRVKPS